MAKTVVGLFDTWNEAQSVVRELESMGFSDNDISVIANQTATGYSGDESSDPSAGERVGHAVGDGVKGALKGGLIGGLTGLAASFALLAIPGIGPVLAAGPIAASLGGAGTVTAATLGGASLGATAGGIIGALTGLGVPDTDAPHYAEGIRRGGTLVSVNADDARAETVMAVFNRHHPVDIEQRSSHYRETGYTGYSPDTKPYSAEELNTYRSSHPNVYGQSSNMPMGSGTSRAATNADIDADDTVTQPTGVSGNTRVNY